MPTILLVDDEPSIRLTVGRCNDADQIDDAAESLADAVLRIRQLA